jgi:hypothetical protein
MVARGRATERTPPSSEARQISFRLIRLTGLVALYNDGARVSPTLLASIPRLPRVRTTMDSFLSLLRLALDRGWALGALLAIFFGGTLEASRFGLSLPTPVQEWSVAGLLFGVAVLLVSLASHIVHGIGTLAKERSAKEAHRAAETNEAREALANIGALNSHELGILLELLTRAPQRFEVHIVSEAWAMIDKGVLVRIRHGAGVSCICEVHPAIVQHREDVVAQLRKVLSITT